MCSAPVAAAQAECRAAARHLLAVAVETEVSCRCRGCLGAAETAAALVALQSRTSPFARSQATQSDEQTKVIMGRRAGKTGKEGEGMRGREGGGRHHRRIKVVLLRRVNCDVVFIACPLAAVVTPCPQRDAQYFA